MVEQVLKRYKGLGVFAHRFFVWATRTVPNLRHSRTSYLILVDILDRALHFPLILDLRDWGDEAKVEFFWFLFRAYCRARLPGDVVRAFQRMEDFEIGPAVEDFHQLLIKLCGNCLMDDVVDYFRKWGSGGAKSYCVLMMEWVDSRKPEGAIKLFDEMVGECELDFIAYNTYMGALCKLGEFGRAHRVLWQMKARGFEPDASTYAVLLRTYCEANDVGSANKILQQLRRSWLALRTESDRNLDEALGRLVVIAFDRASDVRD